MLTYRQAHELLVKYGLAEWRIRHCEGVAGFAFSLAGKIHARHPRFDIDPQKVKIAALLHDIGRAREGLHPVNSQQILRQEGQPQLADIVMHGQAYEIMRLRGTDDPSLLPHSLENKIVAYADTRFRLSPVTLQQRIDELMQRRKNEPEKIKAVLMAKPRYEQLERELLALAGERIPDEKG